MTGSRRGFTIAVGGTFQPRKSTFSRPPSRLIVPGAAGFIGRLNIRDDAVFVPKAGVIKDVAEPEGP